MKGEVTVDTAELQKIIKDHYKQVYANKMTIWTKWTAS